MRGCLRSLYVKINVMAMSWSGELHRQSNTLVLLRTFSFLAKLEDDVRPCALDCAEQLSPRVIAEIRLVFWQSYSCRESVNVSIGCFGMRL